MSSATSTDRALDRRARALGADTPNTRDDGPAFKPWQFFLLAGMIAATATVVVATGQPPASIVLLSLTVVSAGLVGLAVYRSLAPLVSTEVVEAPAMVGGRTRAALEREKTLVLRAIKELEFDFAMKKVAQTDFDEMVGRLRTRAIRIMRQLDAGDGYRTEIEKEIAARLEARGVEARSPSRSADVQGPDQGREGRTCACGTMNDADARFCKKCGTRLG